MKKLILLAFIAVSSLAIKAQTGFQAGVTTGFPIGDSKDYGAQINFSLNSAYLFEVGESFQIGPEVAYDYWLMGEVENTVVDPVTGTSVTVKIDADNISFLPLSANARFQMSEKFMLVAIAGKVRTPIRVSHL